jgi:hypothetical protein
LDGLLTALLRCCTVTAALIAAPQVVEVLDGSDVVCVARNDALLDGLLTVFHVERSSDELLNLQNDLPLLSDYDKECIISLAVVSADSYKLLCSADVMFVCACTMLGLKVTIVSVLCVCVWGGGGDEDWVYPWLHSF